MEFKQVSLLLLRLPLAGQTYSSAPKHMPLVKQRDIFDSTTEPQCLHFFFFFGKSID